MGGLPFSEEKGGKSRWGMGGRRGNLGGEEGGETVIMRDVIMRE